MTFCYLFEILKSHIMTCRLDGKARAVPKSSMTAETDRLLIGIARFCVLLH